MDLKELALVSRSDRSTPYSLRHHCQEPCHERGSEGITVASSPLKICDLRKLWLKLECRLEVTENFLAWLLLPAPSLCGLWQRSGLFPWALWLFFRSWMCEHNRHLPDLVPANTQEPLWLSVGWTIRQCEEGSFALWSGRLIRVHLSFEHLSWNRNVTGLQS